MITVNSPNSEEGQPILIEIKATSVKGTNDIAFLLKEVMPQERDGQAYRISQSLFDFKAALLGDFQALPNSKAILDKRFEELEAYLKT
jgi:hypothetical protein